MAITTAISKAFRIDWTIHPLPQDRVLWFSPQKGSNPMKMQKKEYEAPKVITYTEEEFLEIIGPAKTCTSDFQPT
jgi:hypothetical protein